MNVWAVSGADVVRRSGFIADLCEGFLESHAGASVVHASGESPAAQVAQLAGGSLFAPASLVVWRDPPVEELARVSELVSGDGQVVAVLDTARVSAAQARQWGVRVENCAPPSGVAAARERVKWAAARAGVELDSDSLTKLAQVAAVDVAYADSFMRAAQLLGRDRVCFPDDSVMPPPSAAVFGFDLVRSWMAGDVRAACAVAAQHSADASALLSFAIRELGKRSGPVCSCVDGDVAVCPARAGRLLALATASVPRVRAGGIAAVVAMVSASARDQLLGACVPTGS